MNGGLWTVILCGGRGMRAYPLTEDVPKPLLRIGDVPVVEHVMGIYARRGFTRFILAAGYRGDRLAAYIAERRLPWEVRVVDTGVDTGTGERLRRCAPLVGETFLATYADGLADVDLAGLVEAHGHHGRAATVTTVPLPSQYGTLEVDGQGRVTGFLEKPRLPDHWINAGFFVFDAVAFEHFDGADLERQVLPALASAGELHARRHTGFWRSLDTYKDLLELEACLDGGGAPPWI